MADDSADDKITPKMVMSLAYDTGSIVEHVCQLALGPLAAPPATDANRLELDYYLAEREKKLQPLRERFPNAGLFFWGGKSDPGSYAAWRRFMRRMFQVAISVLEEVDDGGDSPSV